MSTGGLSVITPIFRNEQTLERTLLSVSTSWHSVEPQFQVPTEHVLVLDGRNEECQEIIERFSTASSLNITLIQKSHRGIAASRNTGIETAVYSHVTFLDADDEMTPERVMAASRYSNQAVIGLQRVVYDAPSRPPAGVAAGRPEDQKVNPYLTSMVLPKHHIVEAGGFREELALSDDLDLVMRLRAQGVTVKFVDDVFVVRHVTGTNASLDYASLRREFFTILRASRDAG